MATAERSSTSDDDTDAGRTSYDSGTLKSILQDELTHGDCFELAIYFSLPDKMVNEVQKSSIYVKELVEALEKRTIIREGNISALLIALKDRGLLRLVNKLKEEFKHVVTCDKEGQASTYDNGSAAFGKFKTNVADQFNMDDAVKVAVCLDLKPAKREEIKSARTPGLFLLNYLQKDDIITEDDIHRLCDALTHCHLKSTARIAKEEFEKYKIKRKEGGGGELHITAQGDSVRSQGCVCGGSNFEDLYYNNKLVALQCQNEKCYGEWVVTTSSSDNKAVTMKHGTQTLSYIPPGRLDLNEMKYKEVTDIKDLKPGDHIVFRRGIFYDHHAILVSVTESLKLEIINWTSGSILRWFFSFFTSNSDSTISIKKEEKDFPRGGVKRVYYNKKVPKELVLARAFKMWQDNNNSYSLSKNNCESLATYCRSGVFYSVQGQLLNKYRPFVQKMMN